MQQKSARRPALIRPQSEKGFTLIELMVTITVIAILASVGLVVYSSAQKTARVSKRIQDLKALQEAIELYKTSVGYYPKVGSANKCVNDPTGLASTSLSPNFTPTYMVSIPSDPSGATNCYIYQSDANGVEYKVRTNNTEMIPSEYATQKTLLDPARDGGSGECLVDPPNPAPASGNWAWALYSSAGISPTNSCAF